SASANVVGETGGPVTGPVPNVGGAPGVAGVVTGGAEGGAVFSPLRHATAAPRTPSGAVMRNCLRVFMAPRIISAFAREASYGETSPKPSAEAGVVRGATRGWGQAAGRSPKRLALLRGSRSLKGRARGERRCRRHGRRAPKRLKTGRLKARAPWLQRPRRHHQCKEHERRNDSGGRVADRRVRKRRRGQVEEEAGVR